MPARQLGLALISLRFKVLLDLKPFVDIAVVSLLVRLVLLHSCREVIGEHLVGNTSRNWIGRLPQRTFPVQHCHLPDRWNTLVEIRVFVSVHAVEFVAVHPRTVEHGVEPQLRLALSRRGQSWEEDGLYIVQGLHLHRLRFGFDARRVGVLLDGVSGGGRGRRVHDLFQIFGTHKPPFSIGYNVA